MQIKTNRLHFIDAMRAWAILMMLQGHFVDSLLDPIYRNVGNAIYATWLYFRGITAPVFFTVSGFIFTYLLIRVPQKGLANPRIRKGVKRGLQLLFIGYLLRLNLFGLFQGQLYNSFFLVDVLHCIGISILVIIAVYLLTTRANKWIFPLCLLSITLILFLFEPIYKQWDYTFLPQALANYFTKQNGSVFTVAPWVGYTAFGAFLAVVFKRFHQYKNLYPTAIILSLLLGGALLFFSSPLFVKLYQATDLMVFMDVATNNYLFIRLGDVLIVFGLFMIFRKYIVQPTLLRTGQNTLSIYVIHFIILYGTFTGLGLHRFFSNSLSPSVVILGALLFMVVCTFLALKYDRHEQLIKQKIGRITNAVRTVIQPVIQYVFEVFILLKDRILQLFNVSKS